MKKVVICVLAAALILAGGLTARNLVWEYGHRGEPDVTGMLVIPGDSLVAIDDDTVPLADGPSASSPVETENPYIQQVVDLVNAERAKEGP